MITGKKHRNDDDLADMEFVPAKGQVGDEVTDRHSSRIWFAKHRHILHT